jgi:hypothetical protein
MIAHTGARHFLCFVFGHGPLSGKKLSTRKHQNEEIPMKAFHSSKSLVAALIASGFLGCVPEPIGPIPGPIDGTYLYQGGTCNGKVESGAAAGSVLTFANANGTYVQTNAGDGCTATTPLAFTYPASNAVTILPGIVLCSSSCSAQEQSNFGCQANTSQSAPWNGTYLASGSSLTITIENNNCSAQGNTNAIGTDQEVWDLSKQ